MNPVRMDETFGRALRAALMAQVVKDTVPARRTRRRWWIGAGAFAGAGLLGGIGAAAAGLLPVPGTDRVTVLSSESEGTFTGDAALELGDPPADATHISVALTCLDAGTFRFDSGATITCGAGSTGEDTAAAIHHLPVTDGTRSVEIHTDKPGTRWRVSASYVNRTPTDFGVNANGQTYGTGIGRDLDERPELLAVIASNGIAGYAYTAELNEASGLTATGDSSMNADEAQAWQESRRGKTFSVPVYESDGETPIGEFLIEGIPIPSEDR
jgi:hypothetical protein